MLGYMLGYMLVICQLYVRAAYNPCHFLCVLTLRGYCVI